MRERRYGIIPCFFAVMTGVGLAKAPQSVRPPDPPTSIVKAERYLVQLAQPPLALYQGGIEDLSPTHAGMNKKTHLDVEDPACQAYLAYLRQQHKMHVDAMQRELDREVVIAATYAAAFFGFSAELTPDEVKRVSRMPGVVAVTPDIPRHLHTDAGPFWVEADGVWYGDAGMAAQGEGMVVGVIDTGINPSNPSFAELSYDGYEHHNPRGRFFGVCDPSNREYDPDFPCQGKLIGAYDFTPIAGVAGNPHTPIDVDGHGSHTASTAAGNAIPATVEAHTITLERDISGVAPRAAIISYRACLPDALGGCPLTSLVAAIDQAVMDGVDVINHSIGGDPIGAWQSPEALSFLAAREAGIFVATSAGNDGPGAATLGDPGDAPWLLTVGNSQHNREFQNALVDMAASGGSTLDDTTGTAMTQGYGPDAIVYAGDFANPNDDQYPPGQCAQPFPRGTFHGEIVVCDRGIASRVAKGQNVLQGGAGALVLVNGAADGTSTDVDDHVLPATHLDYQQGQSLLDWLSQGSQHEATLTGTQAILDDRFGDIMASSSSRGPSPTHPDILKPDISAPGTSILAADGTDDQIRWGTKSGTSMASPHAAGAAALLAQIHPDWSPSEIQSAMMLTAQPALLKEDAITAADPFDIGCGRLRVSAAARAGFVMHVPVEDYRAADPALGGEPSQLNLPCLASSQSIGATTWHRTLRSTADQAVTWESVVQSPPTGDVTIQVSPEVFTLQPGGEQTLEITADLTTAAYEQWRFARITFAPVGTDLPEAHFSLAAKHSFGQLPPAQVYWGEPSSGSAVVTCGSARTVADLHISVQGMTPATVHETEIFQDPTPNNLWDCWNPADPECGLWAITAPISGNARRVVAEILDTTAPDLDLFVYHWDGAEFRWLAQSTRGDSREYCSVDDVPGGELYVLIQCYGATDRRGHTPDMATVAVAVVSETDRHNLTPRTTDGGTAYAAGESFDVQLDWDVDPSSSHYYGAFELGTRPNTPGNIGRVPLDLHLSNSRQLLYPWISNREGQFESILIANNLSLQSIDITLTARRANGNSQVVHRSIPGSGFLKERASSLFPELGSGAGYTVVLDAPTPWIRGRWVTNNLTAASGQSPSQGVALSIPGSDQDPFVGRNILFNYLPLTNGFTSAPVIVNVGQAPTEVSLRIYDHSGQWLGTQELGPLQPMMPFAQVANTLVPAGSGDVTIMASSSAQPIVGVSFVFNEIGETAIGNVAVAPSSGLPATKKLFYPWISNNQGLYESIFVANNFSSSQIELTLTGRRANGQNQTVKRPVPGNGFLAEQASSLFGTLGSGPGYAVEMSATSGRVSGMWVTNNLATVSSRSPSLGVACDRTFTGPNASCGQRLLFGFLPITDGFTSAPVIVNIGQKPTDVYLTFLNAQGLSINGTDSLLHDLQPNQPFATVVNNLIGGLGGDVMMIATSADEPITGVAFIFNANQEPAIGNATILDE